jgi:cell division protein FtsZ
MINLGSKAQVLAPLAPVISFKVVGVGGAGLSVLEQLAVQETHLELVAMHTDAQALMGSAAQRKLQLGRETAKGLGVGGDPALGLAAAKESAGAINAECEDAQVVVVCAGLGGGTASGAAPLVAEEAKKNGALVFGLVNLPFESEGEKRREQAMEALSRLGRHCVGVICFENDKMTGMVSGDAPIGEAFSAAASTMSEAVLALARMLRLPSFMRVGLDELIQMFRGSSARCQFGCGVAGGSNRAVQAAESSLMHPLLDGGKIFSESSHVLIHVAGDPSMRLDEVQDAVREVSKNIKSSTQIYLGVATDASADDSIVVTVMSCTRVIGVEGDENIDDEVVESRNADSVMDIYHESGDKTPKAGSKRGLKTGAKKNAAGQTQEELPLDQAMRGRFKDLDPTMVDGQDLDIPTFIRMRLRLK